MASFEDVPEDLDGRSQEIDFELESLILFSDATRQACLNQKLLETFCEILQVTRFTVCETRKTLTRALERCSNPNNSLIVLDTNVRNLNKTDIDLLGPLLRAIETVKTDVPLVYWSDLDASELTYHLKGSGFIDPRLVDHLISKNGRNPLLVVQERGLESFKMQGSLLVPNYPALVEKQLAS